jgi:hypothetical protein
MRIRHMGVPPGTGLRSHRCSRAMCSGISHEPSHGHARGGELLSEPAGERRRTRGQHLWRYLSVLVKERREARRKLGDDALVCHWCDQGRRFTKDYRSN